MKIPYHFPFDPVLMNRWLRGIDWAHRDAVIAPMEFSSRISWSCSRSSAVDLKKFRPPAEPKEDLFRVLYVGTVCLRKG